MDALLLLLLDSRAPAGGARAFRRHGAGGDGRSGARPRRRRGVLPRPAAHVGPGRRRLRRRRRARPRRRLGRARRRVRRAAAVRGAARGLAPAGQRAAPDAALDVPRRRRCRGRAAPHHPLALGARRRARRRHARPRRARPPRWPRSPRRPAPRCACSASIRWPCRHARPARRRSGSTSVARGRRPARRCPPTARRPSTCSPTSIAFGGASLCVLTGSGRHTTTTHDHASRPRRDAAGGGSPASASAARSAAARPRSSPRCAARCRRADDRRRHQRHLHDRGRRLPASRGRAAGRADPRRADRRLPAHRDPRRHHAEPRRGRGARGATSPTSTSCSSRAAATT